MLCFKINLASDFQSFYEQRENTVLLYLGSGGLAALPLSLPFSQIRKKCVQANSVVG